MKQLLFAMLLMTASGVSFAGADGPPIEPVHFPQDTPQRALASVIKALNADKMGYYIAHLVTPAEKDAQIKKYGTVADAAQFQNRQKKKKVVDDQVALLREIAESGKFSQGETKGMKWARFTGDKVVQFELLPDGRWVMNPRITK